MQNDSDYTTTDEISEHRQSRLTEAYLLCKRCVGITGASGVLQKIRETRREGIVTERFECPTCSRTGSVRADLHNDGHPRYSGCVTTARRVELQERAAHERRKWRGGA